MSLKKWEDLEKILYRTKTDNGWSWYLDPLDWKQTRFCGEHYCMSYRTLPKNIICAQTLSPHQKWQLKLTQSKENRKHQLESYINWKTLQFQWSCPSDYSLLTLTDCNGSHKNDPTLMKYIAGSKFWWKYNFQTQLNFCFNSWYIVLVQFSIKYGALRIITFCFYLKFTVSQVHFKHTRLNAPIPNDIPPSKCL